MKYCKKCLMPDTRPMTVFEGGICSACRFAEENRKVDWKARRKELEKLCNETRSKDGYWDCVVPWSSGKDSSMIAHRLKFEFNMNPLLVTVAPQIQTEEGKHNQETFLDLGFDHLLFNPNPKVHKALSKKHFIELGNPWLAWTQAINSLPVQVAVKFNIPNVFYAEGAGTYGASILSEKNVKEKSAREVREIFGGYNPLDWVDEEISLNDLAPYLYPAEEDIEGVGIRAHYFDYYHKWGSYKNYIYAKENWDFMTVQAGETVFNDLSGLTTKGRTEGTFTNYDSIDDKLDNIYYYFQYIKFGFGRAVRDASRLIRRGFITRERGLELVRKYDGEFPARYFKDFLEWTDVTEEQFWEVVNKFREARLDIWEKVNGEWRLKYPPK